ncbi:ribonuclease III domain-containing protein [Porphyromonadaceae bacterium W3.11]|nr:ribonuclease III domain-containing protein [Porphyromonadaceae bacterium W3.11]
MLVSKKLTHFIAYALKWLPIRKVKEKPTQGNRLEKNDDPLTAFLEHLIGYTINHQDLYRQALTHKSYDNVDALSSNERLEYLGDSVISCAVGHALYELYPNESEGTLTSIRSFIVNRNHLNTVAERIGLDTVLYADDSIDLKNSDLLGNALEALVGAIYLDLGFDIASKFVRSRLIVSKSNLKVISKKEEDYKTEFIILMQKHKIRFNFAHIDSHLEKGQGIIHRCALLIGPDEVSIATGIGTSKKIAHQNAAKDALRILNKQPQLLEKYSV